MYHKIEDFRPIIALCGQIEFLKNFKFAQEHKNYSHEIALITHNKIFKDFLKYHPSDQSKIIEKSIFDKDHFTTQNDRRSFINLCLLYIHSSFLTYLSQSGLNEIYDLLGEDIFVLIITNLDSDDAVAVLEELEIEDRLKIISITPEPYRSNYKKLLSYPEQSVGRVMDTDFVFLNFNNTAQEAIQVIRNKFSNEDIREDSASFVVVDNDNNFYGLINLATLVRLKDNDKIKK